MVMQECAWGKEMHKWYMISEASLVINVGQILEFSWSWFLWPNELRGTDFDVEVKH